MSKKPLTIVFVTNNYYPYSAGVVSAIDATVEQLRNCGHQVFIITLDFGYECNIDESSVFRVPCQIKFSFRSSPLAFPFFPSRYILKLIEQWSPDILHVHHPFLLGSCAAKIGQHLDIPVVFTLHMLYEHHIHHVPLPRGITRFGAREQVRRFCQKVSHIIAPSSAVKHYLLEQQVTSPITVIPSGILPIYKDAVLPPSTSDTKRFKLLYVGRFVSEKQVDVLLDVFALLPQERFYLTIVGFGVEYDNLRYQAYQKLGLSEEQVTFQQRQPKHVLVQLYKEADLFLFASRSETQALVLAEAMACGTPVVAFKGFAIDDIVKPGINGMLVETKEEMVRAILELATNKDLLAELGHGARKTAQAYYPEVTVQKLLKVYQDLLF